MMTGEVRARLKLLFIGLPDAVLLAGVARAAGGVCEGLREPCAPM